MYTFSQFIYISYTVYVRLVRLHDICTGVGVNISTMKTIFDFNFDLYQAVKQHGYT